MKKFPIVFWIGLLLFLVNSCNLDSLDFRKLSNEVNLNPTIVAPVAKASISVWDLIQSANQGSEDVITADSVTGLIRIVYNQDDLFKYNVRDFLNFPNQRSFPSEIKELGEIYAEDISFSRTVSLQDMAGSLNGAFDALVPLNGMNVPFPSISYNGPVAPFTMSSFSDFTNITLSAGTLGIIMDNKMEVPVSITGNLYDLRYNRKIADFTFQNIDPNSTSTKSISLAGVQISNRVEFRMETFSTPGSSAPVIIDLADYYKISFSLTDISISQGNLKVKSQTLDRYSGAIVFAFPEPELKAFGAVLKKGSISIQTSISSQLTGTINFTLPEMTKNGVPMKVSIPLPGTSATIDLSGAEINFASEQAEPFNRIPYVYSLSVNQSVGYIDYSSVDAIIMEITLSNLDFKSIQGDFGKRSIPIDPGTFDMNMDMLSKMDGSFKLANPQLKLRIRNSIGMPASVSVNFSASNNEGKTASIDPPDFEIPVPANVNAGVATDSIYFTRQNSNIVDFIALPPTGKISYSGRADFNQIGQVTPQNPNFLDLDNATFAIDMTLELPLELQISNLAFRDTSAITVGDYEKIESADLIIHAKNGIPYDVDMQLFFIDTISRKQYGSSKNTKILKAAQVNASGIITPVQSSQTFSLDKSDMENLRKANGIVFFGIVSSPSGDSVVQNIFSDSKIELNVVIKAKVNL